MFFLKKFSSQSQQPAAEATPASNTPGTAPESPAEVPAATDFAAVQNAPYESSSLFQSSTLFSKLLHHPSVESGPELSYENEAWAPEYQPVRLFHRQWSTAEEQFSSPSGSQ